MMIIYVYGDRQTRPCVAVSMARFIQSHYVYSMIISLNYHNFRPFSRSCTFIITCFDGFFGGWVLDNKTVAHKAVAKLGLFFGPLNLNSMTFFPLTFCHYGFIPELFIWFSLIIKCKTFFFCLWRGVGVLTPFPVNKPLTNSVY